MLARLSALGLLFSVSVSAHGQSADLRLQASVNPSSGLVLGQDVLVTTVVQNLGPSGSQGLLITVAGQPLEAFAFDIVGSETVGCQVESLDIDPVQFNYVWSLPTLNAEAQTSCTVRLRVRRVPAAFAVSLSAQVSASTADPASSNNSVALSLTFGSSEAQSIPATSWWAYLVMTLSVLAFTSTSRKGYDA